MYRNFWIHATYLGASSHRRAPSTSSADAPRLRAVRPGGARRKEEWAQPMRLRARSRSHVSSEKPRSRMWKMACELSSAIRLTSIRSRRWSPWSSTSSPRRLTTSIAFSSSPAASRSP